MADNRDFRIRVDLCFDPGNEGVAIGLFNHIKQQMGKAVNINPDDGWAEIGYCRLERCGHRLGVECAIIENCKVE